MKTIVALILLMLASVALVAGCVAGALAALGTFDVPLWLSTTAWLSSPLCLVIMGRIVACSRRGV